MTNFGRIIKLVVTVFGFSLGLLIGEYSIVTYGPVGALAFMSALFLLLLTIGGVLYAIDVKRGESNAHPKSPHPRCGDSLILSFHRHHVG